MNNFNSLNKRYEAITWGIGFLWIGILGLIPGDQNGIGVLSIGLLLLGLNLMRSLSQIPVNWFTTVVGILASALGVLLLLPIQNFPPFELELFPLMLIVIGLYLLIPGPKRVENG